MKQKQILYAGLNAYVTSKLQMILERLGIEGIAVNPSDYGAKVFQLFQKNNGMLAVGLQNLGKIQQENGKREEFSKFSFIIMNHFSESEMDTFLLELKKALIVTDFKAIMTDTNMHWTLEELLEELKREKIAYMLASRK